MDRLTRAETALKTHLTDEQRTAIARALVRFPYRPTDDEYYAVQRELRAIPVATPPKLHRHTRRGFERRHIVVLPGFNAAGDLASGWALAPLYDSGGNHVLENAAVHVWRHVWNTWYAGT